MKEKKNESKAQGSIYHIIFSTIFIGPKMTHRSRKVSIQDNMNELDNILDKLTSSINQQAGPIIEVNGESGEWINKDDSDNWLGDVPLSKYPIHVDSNPLIINKKYDGNLIIG